MSKEPESKVLSGLPPVNVFVNKRTVVRVDVSGLAVAIACCAFAFVLWNVVWP